MREFMPFPLRPRTEMVMERTGGKPHLIAVGDGRWWIYKNCPPQPGQEPRLHARTYPSFASLYRHEPLPQ